MLNQTVDSLMPLLAILQQPAFCLRSDGSVAGNTLAAALAPFDRDDLPRWLGASTPMYEQWNRKSALTLPLSLPGKDYSVTLQALADGELFLLADCSSAADNEAPLSVSSQVLRQPLADLVTSTQMLLSAIEDQENAALQAEAASITQNLFRLTRMADNLSTYSSLQKGELQPRLTLLSLSADFAPALYEIADIVAEAGISMDIRLPREQVQFHADPRLLEDALLNLISNAMKHGCSDRNMLLQVRVQPGAILFCLHNHCDGGEQDLLTAAFRRTQQRGILPDPRWGMGLGLPLAQQIARLHGGTVALEALPDGSVTVTLSVSRKRPSGGTGLASPMVMDRTGGMDPRLIALSDVLPASVFHMQLL